MLGAVCCAKLQTVLTSIFNKYFKRFASFEFLCILSNVVEICHFISYCGDGNGSFIMFPDLRILLKWLPHSQNLYASEFH